MNLDHGDDDLVVVDKIADHPLVRATIERCERLGVRVRTGVDATRGVPGVCIAPSDRGYGWCRIDLGFVVMRWLYVTVFALLCQVARAGWVEVPDAFPPYPEWDVSGSYYASEFGIGVSAGPWGDHNGGASFGSYFWAEAGDALKLSFSASELHGITGLQVFRSGGGWGRSYTPVALSAGEIEWLLPDTGKYAFSGWVFVPQPSPDDPVSPYASVSVGNVGLWRNVPEPATLLLLLPAFGWLLLRRR